MSDQPPVSPPEDDPSRRQPLPFLQWLRQITRPHNQQAQLHKAITDYIEHLDVDESEDPILADERELLANVLKLPDKTVHDIMLPRADMVAVKLDTPQNELLALLAEDQFSRIPVYQDRLDNIVGTVHIKDILATLARREEVVLANLVREVPLVSPGMSLMDLLQVMRNERKHMVLVVDEYGGIDGLATLGDVLHAIIGQVDDEYDSADKHRFEVSADGSYIVDALLPIEMFEEELGAILNETQRGHIETLGGFISAIAGRIPQEGEEVEDPITLLRFEVMEADGRRIKVLRVHKPPSLNSDGPATLVQPTVE